VAIDRASAVKKAEDLVREGKIDLAIEEYVRLVEDQAGDVGAANALGDLYAKKGDRAAAVAQFVQIGDHHRDTGFVPKAVAFYKKALKVDPASDHALSQLATIAVDQELFADATLYLNRLLQRRREQNNEAGVAECLVRIGSFPTASADAKLAAARASATHLPAEQTVRLWVDAADALVRASREREAVDVLMQASSLDPNDVALRGRVALACATTGQIDRARAFLSFETAGDHPDLLLALAEHALADGRADEARRVLERVMAVAPDRRVEAEAMLQPLVAASDPAPSPTEIPTDFFAVEVDEPQAEVAPEPAPEPEPEPEPAPEAVAVIEEAIAVVEETVVEEEAAYVVPDDEPEPVAVAEPAPVAVVEPEPEPEPEPVAAVEAAPAQEATREELESIATLTAAAQNPALQFMASAQLGRLLLRLGRTRDGIEWLERATQAATFVREQRLDVLYELADALERSGEPARALDVFADLDFDAASHRDVPERMAALRRALEERRAT